jgi:hypothetical protein
MWGRAKKPVNSLRCLCQGSLILGMAANCGESQAFSPYQQSLQRLVREALFRFRDEIVSVVRANGEANRKAGGRGRCSRVLSLGKGVRDHRRQHPGGRWVEALRTRLSPVNCPRTMVDILKSICLDITNPYISVYNLTSCCPTRGGELEQNRSPIHVLVVWERKCCASTPLWHEQQPIA